MPSQGLYLPDLTALLNSYGLAAGFPAFAAVSAAAAAEFNARQVGLSLLNICVIFFFLIIIFLSLLFISKESREEVATSSVYILNHNIQFDNLIIKI